MRKVRVARKRAKARSRLTRAMERASATLQKHEKVEADAALAMRSCLNFQRTIAAKHQV